MERHRTGVHGFYPLFSMNTASNRKMAFFAKSALILLATTLPHAGAVIVSGGGENRTNGAMAGSCWDYVGGIGAASGVYLGQFDGGHWVMTVNHVGAGNFTLGGKTYTPVAGSREKIGTYDMILYRIDVAEDDPINLLPNIRLTTKNTNVILNSEVLMIGYGGASQSSTETTWQVNTATNPDTWTVGTSGGDISRSGYIYTGGHVKSWGTNHVINDEAQYENNPNMYMLVRFDDVDGDAQGVVGDSGGGVFYYDSVTGTWELAGLMDLVTTFNGQPGAAIYGNETFIIPIVNHLDDISRLLNYDPYAPIPEPASSGLILAGGLFLASRRRK